MPRRLLDWKIQRNGNSIKLFEKGVYVGSISLSELSRIIREARG